MQVVRQFRAVNFALNSIWLFMRLISLSGLGARASALARALFLLSIAESLSRNEKENNKSRSGSSGVCRRYDRLSMGCLRRPALQAHEVFYYPYRSRTRTTRRAKARADAPGKFRLRRQMGARSPRCAASYPT